MRVAFRWLVLLWTLLMIGLAAWQHQGDQHAALQMARNLAEESYRKDILYRRWAAQHGGAYVPATPLTPPNPYLDVPERDITTPSGRKLTLVNPAYMTRQVHELGRKADGVRSHITSLAPLNPGNSPDEWERRALEAFERGTHEVSSLEVVEGVQYLRFMQPMLVEESCLKCHAKQGYRLGDVRGGIAVAVPWEPYRKVVGTQLALTITAYTTIWSVGCLVLAAMRGKVRGQLAALRERARELRESESKFRSIITNAPLGFHFYRVAEDGCLLLDDANPAADAILRVSHGDLYGVPVAGALPSLVPTTLFSTCVDLARDGGAHRWDSLEYGGGEHARALEVVAFQTSPDRVAVAFRDVTERRLSERQRQQSEEKFAQIFQTTPDVVVISRARDGFLLDVNPGFEAVTGYTRAEACGQTTLALGLWANPAERKQLVSTLLRDGQVLQQDITFRRKDGVLRVGQCSARPLPGGDEPCLLFVLRDVTERTAAEQALRASEARFRDMLLTATDWFWEQDANFRFTYFSSGGATFTLEQTGINPNDLLGKARWEMPIDWNAEQVAQHRAVLETHLPFRDLEYRVSVGGGRWRWFSINGQPLFDDAGRFVGYRGTGRDITERKQVEHDLRDSEERYRLLFERSGDAIFVVDRQNGRYLNANHAAECLTGRTLSELCSLTTADVTPLNAELRRTVAQAATETVALGEVEYRRPDGSVRTALLSVVPVSDSVFFSIARDVSAIKVAEERIERLAFFDPLTDLPNRTLLTETATQALALAARRREELAILFVDLDHFKEVNDSLGHAEGDALLVQVACRLRDLLRSVDSISRLGGDEFVLLLPDVGHESAQRVAEKVLAALREPLNVGGHGLGVTASIGIAVYPSDGKTFAELLKNADTALYRAKNQGRNHAVLYDWQMNAATLEKLVLEADLRQAIAHGQLRAYYQPQIRLAQGIGAGAEALVRWHHPQRGLISPAQFIPVAEASDLIVALGDWMLEEVCRQIATWQKNGQPVFRVAVNLAARHFRLPRLVERVSGLLDEHGLSPALLELELTESTLMQHEADSAATLLALRRLGVGLALDDFGTGYSSLSYLGRLPLTTLKIDRGFIRDLVTNRDARTLAETIVTLGRQLGLSVVAEGVEHDAQRSILVQSGCDMAQGYLFGQPLPASEFVEAFRHLYGHGQASVAGSP